VQKSTLDLSTVEFEKLSHYPTQLSRLCWVYLFVNISYILVAPWILELFTKEVWQSQLIAGAGVFFARLGAYLTLKIHHRYLIRSLIVLACFVLGMHIILMPQVYLYFVPFLITPIFISCIRLSSRDFYFGVISVTLCMTILWLYAYYHHALTPPFSLYFTVYVLIVSIFMSLSFWFIYNDCLQNTWDWVSQTHHQLSREQKRMQRSHKAKSTFLNHLGHELRLPLNFITYQRTSLQLLISHYLETKKLDESTLENLTEMNNDLSKIQISSDSLNGLLDDLLNLSEEASPNIQVNVSCKPLGEVLTLFDEAIQNRTSRKLVKIYHSVSTEIPIYLDHERSLKLLCVLVKYLYKCIPHAELSLYVFMNENQDLILEIRDYNILKLSLGHHKLNTPSLPILDTPTLSIPQAEPSVVLSQRLANTLKADLNFHNTAQSNDYKTRLTLTLPQMKVLE
jgi:signal transduction histidine kinase